MVNDAKTVSRCTSVPLVSGPQSQSQEGITECTSSLSSSSVSSYAIGPIDSAQITLLHVPISNGEACALLVPVHLPPSLLTDPIFKEGYKCSYSESDPEEEWTVPKLVNEVYYALIELFDESDPDFCPWTLGFLLGELASLAERDRTLALTGLAHYATLLSFFPLDCSRPWFLHGKSDASALHREALRIYRGRVRVYREQGMGFEEGDGGDASFLISSA